MFPYQVHQAVWSITIETGLEGKAEERGLPLLKPG
jgi:hypothetical protein